MVHIVNRYTDKVIQSNITPNSLDLLNNNSIRGLLRAAFNGHTETINLFSKMKIDINAYNRHGNTALILASMRGHYKSVSVLLSIPNIDINKKDNEGRTALIWTSIYGKIDIVYLLLKESNININIKDNYGYTAFIHACTNGHTEIALLLLSTNTIDINQKTDNGSTSLTNAINNGYLETVSTLLSIPDLNINIQTNTGASALSIALDNSYTNITSLLLSNTNINIFIKKYDGNSLLHVVCNKYNEILNNLESEYENYEKIVLQIFNEIKMLILEYDLDPWLLNKIGKTPLDLIDSSKYNETYILLHNLWSIKILKTKIYNNYNIFGKLINIFDSSASNILLQNIEKYI